MRNLRRSIVTAASFKQMMRLLLLCVGCRSGWSVITSPKGGLAHRVRARRGPMTGSGVTRLFIIGERRTTRGLSSGAPSRDPLANPLRLRLHQQPISSVGTCVQPISPRRTEARQSQASARWR